MAMKVITIPGEGPDGKMRDAETVQYLVELWDAKSALQFSDEYQRAPVWKRMQEQLFIDSIFRGYSIPAFYFHKTGSIVRGLGGERYEVVDGQQRIRAICRFANNHLPLLSKEAFDKLPPFLTERDTTWYGCYYKDLPQEMKDRFLRQPIVIYEMTTDEPNEIRDLFIRLQGGTPLSPQDKRDAYPGKLPKFVMEMGGKRPNNNTEIGCYRGHKFFTELTKGGEQVSRKLAAQLLLLISHNTESGKLSVCDINSRALDSFYLRSVGNFSDTDPTATRFKKSINVICEKFGSGMPKLAGHEAIHLVLLVNSLSDGGYVSGWEDNLREAFSQFYQNYKIANDDKEGDYYMRYVRWVSQSSDRASTIEERHGFFMGEMLRMLAPKAKDKRRIFSEAEKKYFHWRDRSLCQWCRMRGYNHTVNWGEKDHYHHIIPHAEGGKTELENGALMHAKCHLSLTPDAVVKFREWWESEGKHVRHPIAEKGKKRKISDLPEGTNCRFEHEDEIYEGKIVGGKLVMDIGKFTSFKKPSETITRDTRDQNWWESWDIQEPGNEHWIPASNWQPGGR